MASDAEYLVTYVLTICLSFLKDNVFQVLCSFLNQVVFCCRKIRILNKFPGDIDPLDLRLLHFEKYCYRFYSWMLALFVIPKLNEICLECGFSHLLGDIG
jgi:hypothetical protein